MEPKEAPFVPIFCDGFDGGSGLEVAKSYVVPDLNKSVAPLGYRKWENIIESLICSIWKLPIRSKLTQNLISFRRFILFFIYLFLNISTRFKGLV